MTFINDFLSWCVLCLGLGIVILGGALFLCGFAVSPWFFLCAPICPLGFAIMGLACKPS